MSIQRKTSDLLPRSVTAPATSKVSAGFVRSSDKLSQLTVRIDANLHRRFKAQTVTVDTSMSEVIETLITNWVSEQDQS